MRLKEMRSLDTLLNGSSCCSVSSLLQENIQSKPMEMLRDMLGWDEDGKPKPPKSGCS